MYRITKLCLILCTISLIKAVSLKIDGLLNLGDKWSYEYRIPRTATNATRSLPDEEGDRMQKQVKRLRMVEQMLRQEVEKKRRDMHLDDVAHLDDEHTEEHADIEDKTDEKSQKHNKGSEKPATHETRKPKQVKEKKSAKVKDKFSSDENRSLDNDSTKNRTMVIYDETTKKPKKILRYKSETEESSDIRDSSERSTSWEDETTHYVTDDDATSSSQESNMNTVNHKTQPRATQGPLNEALEKPFNDSIHGLVKQVILSKFTRVTTVRTENIYTDVHSVKDDAKITEFTNHLFLQTLQVFDLVKKKTDQDHVKSLVDRLAKSYEDKFKEYLRDTSGQKIKTRLGTQKVILNTIDISNRILRRVMDFMVEEMDQQGILKHNAATANIFQKAIDTEQNMEMVHACRKFGICRTNSGFSAFLADILAILMKMDDAQFKQSIDAFTEVVSSTDFSKILNRRTENKVKSLILRIKKQDVVKLRAMVRIVRNTIIFRNKPVAVNNKKDRSHTVNSTLAILEIIDLLETKIPMNEANVLEWTDMKNSLEEFESGKRRDIQEIMLAIVEHVKNNLMGLDEASQKQLNTHLRIILTGK